MGSSETMMQALQSHLERQEVTNRQLILDMISVELRLAKVGLDDSPRFEIKKTLKMVHDMMLDRGGHSTDELRESIRSEVSDPAFRDHLLSLLDALPSRRRIE